MIKWPYGNTLNLVIDLYVITRDESTVSKDAYEPPAGSVVTINFVSRFNKYNFDCTVEGSQVSCTDDATLSCGTYGVELTVVEPDTKRRSFKCNQIEIVDSMEDLDVGEFITQESVAEMEAVFIAGRDGKSAYEVAVENGFEGTEEEWLASLVGPQGETGPQGPQGEAGTTDYEELENKPDLTIYMEKVTEETFNEIFN